MARTVDKTSKEKRKSSGPQKRTTPLSEVIYSKRSPSKHGASASAGTGRRTRALSRVIRHYQKTTNLLLRKAPFLRVVREIADKCYSREELRWQIRALSALHEAAEAFLKYGICVVRKRRKHGVNLGSSALWSSHESLRSVASSDQSGTVRERHPMSQQAQQSGPSGLRS